MNSYKAFTYSLVGEILENQHNNQYHSAYEEITTHTEN